MISSHACRRFEKLIIAMEYVGVQLHPSGENPVGIDVKQHFDKC